MKCNLETWRIQQVVLLLLFRKDFHQRRLTQQMRLCCKSPPLFIVTPAVPNKNCQMLNIRITKSLKQILLVALYRTLAILESAGSTCNRHARYSSYKNNKKQILTTYAQKAYHAFNDWTRKPQHSLARVEPFTLAAWEWSCPHIAILSPSLPYLHIHLQTFWFSSFRKCYF